MRCTALLGMSTAAWMRLPATRLRIADLTPTQAADEPLWLQQRLSPVSSADPLIHVARGAATCQPCPTEGPTP